MRILWFVKIGGLFLKTFHGRTRIEKWLLTTVTYNVKTITLFNSPLACESRRIFTRNYKQTNIKI